MFKNPYSQFHNIKLVLRDYLAVDRTILANERTLLAYFRTGLALLVAGASFIQFFQLVVIQAIGWMFIPLSIIIIITGIIRYRKINNPINKVKYRKRSKN